MRFKEFKLLSEGTKGNQADASNFKEPGYFTVGDSHSNGVGNYGRGKNWKALGMDGASAFDSMHLAQIKKIPKGSVVAISLGANDLGKKQISQIVSQVQSVISAAKDQGLEVVYLLPTATEDQKNKEKREELRNALGANINVPIYDLGTVKGGDGIHQPMNIYSGIAGKIASEHSPKSIGSNLGNSEQKPGAPTTKDRIKNSPNLEQGPPYPVDQKDDVIKLQKSLQELGYSVGRTGVDGKYGPYTASAVAAFKKDYKLDGNGSSFSDNEYKMLSMINSGQVARVKDPTRSNTSGMDIDIPAMTSVENVGKAKKVAEDFLGRKMNDDEWKHLIQTTSAESSPNSVEMAQIAAVILNRTRSNYGGRSTVVDVVWAPGQFEPVTGHPKKGGGWTGPHPNFTTPVGPNRLAAIVNAFINHLPNADKSYLNFTSANPAAYKTASGRKFLDRMIASGGEKIGGTVFGTVA
jgi:hypothetical protein